jgi:hypothetical protein
MFRCKQCKWESPTMVVRCQGCKTLGTMAAVADTGDAKPSATPAPIVRQVTPPPVVKPAPIASPVPVPRAIGLGAPSSPIPVPRAFGLGAPSSPIPVPRAFGLGAPPSPIPVPRAFGLGAPSSPKGLSPFDLLPASAPPTLHIVGTPAPLWVAAPARAVKMPPSPTVAAATVPMPQTVTLRSSAGTAAAAEIDKVFTEKGLWLRSVQFKNCQCITDPDIPFNTSTRSVSGLYADSWTYAHPTIAQYLFQLHPTEGKRAVALIVDWTKTADRYVEYSFKDMSSNKRFGERDFAKPPDQTDKDMTRMRAELAGLKSVEHNEVRTCQVNKEALVGLIWSPILRPTGLSDGAATWDESRAKFVTFVAALKRAGAAEHGLPVFMYEVAGGMTLTYLDFIA